MAESILGIRLANDTVYQLNESTWSWEAFAPQPPASQLAAGIWGGPNDTIWAHNNLYQAGTSKYQFFNGASWSEHTGPDPLNSFHVAHVIHGSDDGLHVYAGVHNFGGTGEVHKWNGSVWARVASGWRPGAIWCDSTGQYVWAAAGRGDRRQTVYYSDDYGSTWVNKYSEIETALGGAYGTNRGIQGVWGTSPTNVFVDFGFQGSVGGGIGSYVMRWNGSAWSIASNVPDTDSPTNGTNLWTDGTSLLTAGGWSTIRVLRDVSGTMVRVIPGVFHGSVNGRGIMGRQGVIVAVLRALGGQVDIHKYSTDGGANWSDITLAWTNGENTGIHGLTLAGWVTQFPPELQNESPTDGTFGVSSTASTYQEITDPNSDIDPSLTLIYIDGTLAWSAGVVQSGFTGAVSPISQGYAYTVTPVTPFANGPHTVRVFAEDSLGNTLDTTRSFSVGTCGYVQWGFVQWGQHQWGETQLAPIITPVSPTNGATDVDRDAPIIFDITSPYSFDVAASTFYVGGSRVYYGAANSFDGDWAGSSFATITNGSRVTLVPNIFAKYDLGEIVTVRVVTSTDLGCEADVQWSFTVTFDSAFRLRIYHMLLGSVRRMSEVD